VNPFKPISLLYGAITANHAHKNIAYQAFMWYNMRKELIVMSPQKNNRRLAAVKLADAVNKIEGVPVSRWARLLSAQWARGEISGDDMKKILVEAHKQSSEGARNA